MTEREHKPHYRVRPVTTPVTSGASEARDASGRLAPDPFLRDKTEDDDGYDPFSDRPPAPEPSFQEDPWR